MTCWCGHESGAHDVHFPLPGLPSRAGVVTIWRGRCRAKWTERGGKDRVHCNCEQYAPERSRMTQRDAP